MQGSWEPWESPLLYSDELEWCERDMRVGDKTLKSAVFIGRELDDRSFRPLATGFLVSAGYMEFRPAMTFQYVVTCQHVIQGENEDNLRIRVNKKDGTAEPIRLKRGWFYHPDPNRYVDVAVAPIQLSPQVFDIAPIPTGTFCNGELLTDRDVGPGDELFYPGLFLSQYGRTANMPVTRLGTVAALVDKTDLVTTESGAKTRAHLIESRSIGGHSGSPVFLNLLVSRTYYADKKITLPLPHQIGYPFFGMLRSHLNAKDSGEYTTESKPSTDWINSGIATVVPAMDIFDALNQEDLRLMREQDHKAEAAKSADVPDKADVSNASENPQHLKDFTRLVDVAARKRPQGDQT
jgi:hypothetical protein